MTFYGIQEIVNKLTKMENENLKLSLRLKLAVEALNMIAYPSYFGPPDGWKVAREYIKKINEIK